MLGALFNIVVDVEPGQGFRDPSKETLDWMRPRGQIRTVRFVIRKTAMAATMARIDVAKRRRLRIVGAAKRDGQTAISHQHGKFVDLI